MRKVKPRKNQVIFSVIYRVYFVFLWLAWFKTAFPGTSLVVQWIRICLPVQGTWVWSLVQEDPTGCRVTWPSSHNYLSIVMIFLFCVYMMPNIHVNIQEKKNQPTIWGLFYKMSNFNILGNNWLMFFIFILIFPVTQSYPEHVSIIWVTI